MAEVLICTGDIYGTDGRANLPNFTEDVDWKGLEDLYSINETLYGYRNNYRLSLDDWANYLKDVDRVFALLNSNSKQTRRNETLVTQPDGFSNASQYEMASAESEEEFSGAAAEDREPVTETNFSALNMSIAVFNNEKKLETVNDFPEQTDLNQSFWSNGDTERSTDVAPNPYEVEFSGNGLIGMESKNIFHLQTNIYLSKERQQDRSLVSGDIFEDQVYLPIDSNPVHQMSLPALQLDSSKKLETTKNISQSGYSEEISKDNVEGSALSPLFV